VAGCDQRTFTGDGAGMSKYITAACASGHCGACQGQNNSECHCKCHDVCRCGHERDEHSNTPFALVWSSDSGMCAVRCARLDCQCEGFEREE